jgi:putative ABC transport system permease protein
VARATRSPCKSGTGNNAARGRGSLRAARRPAHRRDGHRRCAMALQQTGKLSRIDLKLRQGVNRDAFKAELQQDLQRQYPGRFRVWANDENQNSRNEG